MSLFLAPIGVVGELEKHIRSFLWGRSNGGRGIPWIAWEICKSAQVGGFGVGFLARLEKNKVLLLKWSCRFGKENNALWRKFVCAKYDWDD